MCDVSAGLRVFIAIHSQMEPGTRSHLFQMTGLDVEKDQIIEMACIITDSDLNAVAEVRTKNRDGISHSAVRRRCFCQRAVTSDNAW